MKKKEETIKKQKEKEAKEVAETIEGIKMILTGTDKNNYKVVTDLILNLAENRSEYYAYLVYECLMTGTTLEEYLEKNPPRGNWYVLYTNDWD